MNHPQSNTGQPQVTILVATRNRHKTAEIGAILGPALQCVDLTLHPEIPEPIEDGETFEANAKTKALAASSLFDGLVLADDSGLEVDALNGAPGVRSARFAGEKATDAENRAKLLAELQAVGARGKDRTARFRCVLVLARGDLVLSVCSGAVEGIITPTEKGSGGFGYDPLFVPEGFCETFAELPAETKNNLSHRGRALAALREAWDLLNGEEKKRLSPS